MRDQMYLAAQSRIDRFRVGKILTDIGIEHHRTLGARNLLHQASPILALDLKGVAGTKLPEIPPLMPV